MARPNRCSGDGAFRVVYNPGRHSVCTWEAIRWIFMALTIGALVILWRLYQQTRVGDRARTMAMRWSPPGHRHLIGRIARNRCGRFIDVGAGVHRWPTFNIADMAVSSGAFPARVGAVRGASVLAPPPRATWWTP
jgi:signal peptidase II